ncbi:Plasmodium exported protein, unknown function [Plasmodium sp.]|nr:Plasmodium exported protein, unknown function [Plasmodium sp.]
MNFFYINIFLLFVSLRHFISLYKDYNKKNIYTNEIYNSFFNLKFKRSLGQNGEKESVNNTLVINSLTKETILYDKLLNRNDENDETENENNIEGNLHDKIERNYGVNKKLENEFEKYYIKNNSSKSISCIIRFKNWLYRKIFKERGFWVYLSMFTSVLGAGAAASLINMLFIFICNYGVSLTYISIFAGFWGVLVGILILLIIGTWMLVTWLWQHKDIYNETCIK